MNKKNKKVVETSLTESVAYWDVLLHDEFRKETDRGAVILAGSLFDIALKQLIKSYLVPNPTSKDDLFDGPNAPFGSFSAKITVCFRIGLISQTFARDLNLIRKIRNEFAHNIHGCNFEHSGVQSRVQELSKSSKIFEKNQDLHEKYPTGIRGEFLMICSWMLWSINDKSNHLKPIDSAKKEFGYLSQEVFDKVKNDDS